MMFYDGIKISTIYLMVNHDWKVFPDDPVNTGSASGMRDMLKAMNMMADAFVYDNYRYVVKTVSGLFQTVDDYNLFTD